MSATDIMACGPTQQCDLCLWTAHSAAFPVKPIHFLQAPSYCVGSDTKFLLIKTKHESIRQKSH